MHTVSNNKSTAECLAGIKQTTTDKNECNDNGNTKGLAALFFYEIEKFKKTVNRTRSSYCLPSDIEPGGT